MTVVRIGLLGCGSIGGFLARHVLAEAASDAIELSYVDDVAQSIVADPAVSTNAHLVEVEGTGYRFRIEVSSEAAGKVTGAYTLQSALSTLRRICRGQGGLRFV